MTKSTVSVELTEKYYGYDPRELSEKSSKQVYTICECGTVRALARAVAEKSCRKCARKDRSRKIQEAKDEKQRQDAILDAYHKRYIATLKAKLGKGFDDYVEKRWIQIGEW